MNEDKNTDHIGELKDRLDSKAGGMILRKRQGILHDTHISVTEDWKRNNNEDIGHAVRLIEQHVTNHTNMFKKFFIGSIVFFIFAVMFSLYIFLGDNNTVSNKNVDITVVGSSYTAGGEDLPLQILIANNNPVPLELADLFIDYPKGTSGSVTGDIAHITKSVGSIDANGTITIPITPILYGEQGSTKDITLRLEYHTSGSNAIFTKDKTYGVTIATAPLTLSLDGPTQASANQKVTFKIKVVSNTKNVSANTRLSIEYPTGFQYMTSDPAPLYGNSIWDLGDLKQDQEKYITVSGTLSGVDGDQRTFLVKGGSENTDDKTKIGVIFNSLAQIVTIQKPFISTKLSINNSTEDTYVTSGSIPLNMIIDYQNNLPVQVTDAQISVHFSGNTFNKKAVTTSNGFYDATTQTVTWTKDTMPVLSKIDPSSTGRLNFSITPLSVVQQLGSFITDPQINVEVSIKGSQPAEGNNSVEVNSIEKKTIKVGTDFNLATKAVYSNGPFVNSGPIPPKAGQATTYTITFSLKNTTNPVSDAKVVATLPVWCDFMSQIYPTNQSLLYDQVTRNITWNIGGVDRGIGFGSLNREVSFQVKLKPGASQIHTQPALVTKLLLSSSDTFTGSTISIAHQDITTKMTADPTFSSSENGSVVQ